MGKVTVVIPVYNTEKYLSRCFDSVVGQTYRDLEIIIVNDGSTDGSRRVIDEYAARDDRIVAITQENRGLGIARNRGIDAATGEYLSFIDSDDCIDATMIEKLMKRAKDTNAEIAVCDMYDVYGDKKILLRHHFYDELAVTEQNMGDVIRLAAQRRYYSTFVSLKLFNRDFLNRNGIRFEESAEIFAEDTMFSLRCILYPHKLARCDEALYYYITRAGSLMNRKKRNMVRKHLNMIKEVVDEAKEIGRYEHIKNGLPHFTCAATRLSLQSMRGVSEKRREAKAAYEFDFFLEHMRAVAGDRGAKALHKLFARLFLFGNITLIVGAELAVELVQWIMVVAQGRVVRDKARSD